MHTYNFLEIQSVMEMQVKLALHKNAKNMKQHKQ